MSPHISKKLSIQSDKVSWLLNVTRSDSMEKQRFSEKIVRISFEKFCLTKYVINSSVVPVIKISIRSVVLSLSNKYGQNRRESTLKCFRL